MSEPGAMAARNERRASGLEKFRRVRVELPDTHGVLRGKVVASGKAASSHGLRFCDAFFGLSVDDDFTHNRFTSPQTGFEDFVAVPDLDTVRPIPWEEGTGAVLADLRTKDGEPHPLCQREAVRRATRRAEAAGYSAKVALEFEIFAARAEPQALAERRYADLLPLSHLQQAYSFQRWPDFGPFADQLHADLPAYGVELECIHTELGYGALEVSLKPSPPLDATDAAARFKSACKEIATRHGLVATFMAKWSHDEPGSSGHLNQSLWREGEPAFWDGEIGGLSAVGASYLEGVLAATGDLAAVYGPFVNSYRRPDPVYWAPTVADWGTDDRLTCCRVVAPYPGVARIEQRRGGADLALYLAVAGCLASGMRGVEEDLKLRPRRRAPKSARPTPSDCPPRSPRRPSAWSARRSPPTFSAPELVEHFAAGRRVELEVATRHDAEVPPWELARYFETV